MRMKTMKTIVWGLLFALILAGNARAQGYIRIPTCGTAAPPSGSGPGYMDSNGNICFTGGGSSSPTTTTPAALTPVASSQMGLGVVTATALTVPATATTAICTVEGQSVRYRDDGTDPTASVGSLVAVGSILTLKLTSFTAAKFIQTGATATLDCMYYK